MLSRKILRPLAWTVLLMTAPVTYSQSAPTKVKVGDVEYTITPMSRGRMLRVDDPDGHLIGMASVNGDAISVLAPQQEPGFSIVKGAANAYLHSANGAPPPPTASDSLTAQRDAAIHDRMARLNTQSANAGPAAPAQSIVFPPEGGAIVKGTTFGDITYSADGTEARAVQKTTNPLVGATTITLIAKYEGGDDPGKGKTGSTVGGGLKVLAESGNVRQKGEINTRGNDVIKVSQSTNGGKETEMLTTGDKHVAQSEYTTRDLNGPNIQRANGFLSAAWQGLKDAMDEAKKRRSAGEAVPFDPASTVAGQNALKEYDRYEAH
jgi:hypothetical protein